VVVLTLGLVCFIATYLFVSYLHSFDRSFANVDRAYVITQTIRAESSGIDPPFGVRSAKGSRAGVAHAPAARSAARAV
jgi:hypothetical protein